MQIKAIKDKTTNLLKWLKLKQLSTPSVGEDAKQTELSYITGGNAILNTIMPQNNLTQCIPERNSYTNSKMLMYKDNHGTFSL